MELISITAKARGIQLSRLRNVHLLSQVLDT
jgi:hypothetical protein